MTNALFAAGPWLVVWVIECLFKVFDLRISQEQGIVRELV